MTRRRLKYEDWPKRDQAAWQRLMEPGGLFQPGGAFSSLRPATIWSREQSYGHWLSFCRQMGLDLATTEPLDRATNAMLDAWVTEMSRLADTTRHTRLVGLRCVLHGIAPDVPQPHLRALCRRAEWHANRQVRTRKIGRVLPVDTLVTSGLEHLAPANGTTFADAVRFRDGLMVASLALLPLRIGNFRDLEIGRSFCLRPGGYDVVLQASETKNGAVFEAEVPARLIPHFDRYLRVLRPILLTKAEHPHDRLWANDWGQPYSHSHLGARITRLTKAMTGVAISPHLFRDSVATTLVRRVPSKARASAGALGHRTLRTADRHYNQAKCLDASRSYSALVEELAGEESVGHPVQRQKRRRSE